jgi:SAM-dependent methyltransferase
MGRHGKAAYPAVGTAQQQPEHGDWFDENAARFRGAAAIEVAFLELSPEEQYRLNRFKLWALERAGLVSLAGKDVLEFGAGHGRLAVELPVFASYTGVELSPNLVEIGRERLRQAGLSDRARLIGCDCLGYDGPAEAFDVVCSLGMFGSLSHPEEVVLRKMMHHLKPGGTLFMDVRHWTPLYGPIRQLRWRFGATTGVRRHLHSRGRLRALLGVIGLTDVHILMREYPLLGGLYARWGWSWPLGLRNWLAAHSWLDMLGTDCFVFGTKPG